MEPNDIVADIKKRLNVLTVLVAVVILGLGGMAAWNRDTGSNANETAVAAEQETERTLDALCAVRAGEETSVQASEDFLLENPKGIPGITPALIKTGIANRKRTIKALSDLDCPAPKR